MLSCLKAAKTKSEEQKETEAMMKSFAEKKKREEADGWKTVEKKTSKNNGQLGILGTVWPAGVNVVGSTGGEWEEIEMAVDSGATETVIGEEMLQGIQLKEGEACRRGVKYEVADGTLIPNLGEKEFVAVGEGGEMRGMTAQVCEVNKALLSVSKMVKQGNKVVFEEEGAYVEDRHTGERMYLKESGGMYMMKLWVKSGFLGQAKIDVT
jgi:hypothetical protein